MVADRRRQVLCRAGLGRGHQTGPDALGATLQVREHLAGGRLVAASRRGLDDHAVAVAGEVGSRLVADALGTVPAGRHRRGPQLPLAVPPSGEPHPLTTTNSAPGGSGRVTIFLKTLPMTLPSLQKFQAEVGGEEVGPVEPE